MIVLPLEALILYNKNIFLKQYIFGENRLFGIPWSMAAKAHVL